MATVAWQKAVGPWFSSRPLKLETLRLRLARRAKGLRARVPEVRFGAGNAAKPTMGETE